MSGTAEQRVQAHLWGKSRRRPREGHQSSCLLGCRGTCRHCPTAGDTGTGRVAYGRPLTGIESTDPILEQRTLNLRAESRGQPRRGGAAPRRGGGLNIIGRREARSARYIGGTREVRRRYPGGTSRGLSHRLRYRRTRRCQHGTNALRHWTARTSRMLNTGNGFANCHRHRGLSPQVPVSQHLGRSVALASWPGMGHHPYRPVPVGPSRVRTSVGQRPGRPSGRSLSPRRFR